LRLALFLLFFPFSLPLASAIGEGGSRRLTDEVYHRFLPPRDPSLRSRMTAEMDFILTYFSVISYYIKNGLPKQTVLLIY
jgi:hypothetical protein